jgi:hypothetical protein
LLIPLALEEGSGSERDQFPSIVAARWEIKMQLKQRLLNDPGNACSHVTDWLTSPFEFNSTLASKQHENLATADHAWVKVAAVRHVGRESASCKTARTEQKAAAHFATCHKQKAPNSSEINTYITSSLRSSVFWDKIAV